MRYFKLDNKQNIFAGLMEENRKIEVESVEKGMGNTTEVMETGDLSFKWNKERIHRVGTLTFKSQLRRVVEK